MRSCTILILTLGLTLICGTSRADLAGYQGVINGQSPMYYNTFDNTLAPSVGTGTFAATNGAPYFGASAWGDANSAVYFGSTTDQLSYATAGNIVSGANTSTGVGSLSLLFYVPSTWRTTGNPTNNMVIFSDNDTTAPTQFSLNTGTGGLLQYKFGNISTTMLPAGSLAGGNWYYLAWTWDGTIAVNTSNCFNWYIGALTNGAVLQTGGALRGSTSPNIGTTGFGGNAGPFVVSGKQAGATTGLASGTSPGAVDELATWSRVLTTTEINSQFAAAIIHEPSTVTLIALGGLLLIGVRARSRR